MNTIILTEEKAKKNFYPPPADVAGVMLKGINLKRVHTVLEPSAGKGDLIYALTKASKGINDKLVVDAVELDPNLRTILTDRFGGAYESKLFRESEELRRKSFKDTLSEEEVVRQSELRRETELLRTINEFYVVHDDFLTFDTRKRYDLILMNPPFDDADSHLLKAISLLAPGGQLCCLLNAETLLNPYTNRRKELQKKLTQLSAEVSRLGDCFSASERATDVDVAMVRIVKPTATYRSRIWDELEAAAKAAYTEQETQDVTVTDFIESRIACFNLECDAVLALLREYRGMQPYIMRGSGAYATPIIELQVGGRDAEPDRVLRLIRAKYWNELLRNEQFMSRMTSEIRSDYCSKIDKLANYDFSAYNIQRIMLEIQGQLITGAKDSILKLFETLSAKHAWYPECDNNIHYYDGWATNKAHAVNKKVIVPCYGIIGNNSYDKNRFYGYKAHEFLSDLEKALDYLTASPGDETNWLSRAMDAAERTGNCKNIDLRYFKVTFYKKGTCHITFHNQEIVDRLNIFCAREKNWLPPSYGRKKYCDMTEEEQAVVDGLNGDGTQGSGSKSYEKVLADPNLYLSNMEQISGSGPLLIAG